MHLINHLRWQAKLVKRWSGFTQWRRTSLVVDGTVRIFLVSMGLALLFMTASVVLIRDQETRRLNGHVEELLSTVESAVRIACFTSDAALATDVADGLLTNQLLAGVKIRDEQGVLVSRQRAGERGLDDGHHHVLRHKITSPFNPAEVVGEIELTADGDYIHAQAFSYSLMSAIVLLLEVLAVVLVVALVILRTVVRPIQVFSARTHAIQIDSGTHVIAPEGNDDNEIGQLARDFNHMIDNMSTLLDVEQGMREEIALNEHRFRTLAENSPDIIIRYDRLLRRIFVNPAYARETGITVQQGQEMPADDATTWKPQMPLEEYRARLQGVMETGQSDQILLEWLAPSGKFVSHEMHVVAEYDTEGQVIGALAIGRDVTQRKAAELQLTHQATHDALTGLPNRVLLKDRLQQALAQSKRDGRDVAVIFVDLDNFKGINDTMGHDVGDELLKIVASRMSLALRAGDTVARLGGDEFVILLQDSSSMHGLEEVVRKVFAAICEPCEIAGRQLYVTASMGIAVYPKDGTDADTLMGNADTAMYAAKSHGRNNYQFFSEDMNLAAHEWLELSNDLRHAARNGELELHYQPKAELKSGRLSGMEALIRWRHPRLGMVSPARFIPIAEECGLIGDIGVWVLNEACRQLRQWLDAGLAPVRIAVNLSAVQCQTEELFHQVKSALDAHGIEGTLLEVEITESVVVHDVTTAIRTFTKLRDLGVHVAIDDFGTGYSSLSYLKKFPVETLKIDKSFVDDIQRNSTDVQIIVAIIAMAHSLGLKVVAEGTELQEQIEFLRQTGCNEVQGYYFSQPLPALEMAAFMRAGTALQTHPLKNEAIAL